MLLFRFVFSLFWNLLGERLNRVRGPAVPNTHTRARYVKNILWTCVFHCIALYCTLIGRSTHSQTVHFTSLLCLVRYYIPIPQLIFKCDKYYIGWWESVILLLNHVKHIMILVSLQLFSNFVCNIHIHQFMYIIYTYSISFHSTFYHLLFTHFVFVCLFACTVCVHLSHSLQICYCSWHVSYFGILSFNNVWCVIFLNPFKIQFEAYHAYTQ